MWLLIVNCRDTIHLLSVSCIEKYDFSTWIMETDTLVQLVQHVMSKNMNAACLHVSCSEYMTVSCYL